MVVIEEAAAKKQADEAEIIANEAQLSVAEANKKLDETLKEVGNLTPAHLVEVKSFTKPTKACVVVLHGLVILC